MMGVYTKSNLKSSQGNKSTLRFFTLVSSVFAKIENMPICPGTNDNYNILVAEIRQIDKKLNIISRLCALSVAIKNIKDTTNQKGYYILQLNYQKKTLCVRKFSLKQIKAATNIYNKIEALSDPNIDVVLVSAVSFNSLKAAYPNYFTDISQFINIMKRILA